MQITARRFRGGCVLRVDLFTPNLINHAMNHDCPLYFPKIRKGTGDLAREKEDHQVGNEIDVVCALMQKSK